MDRAVEDVLEEYHGRAAREAERMAALTSDAFGAVRDEFLLPVGPQTGRMLHLLATGAGATRLLEIGTSYGYSTVWLADAARANGGSLVSIDLRAEKQVYAAERLERAGLRGQVEFRAGDALEIVAELAGPFDFVLIDAWKTTYVPCFERLYPRLAPGALVAADNMLFPEGAREHARAYQACVRRYAGMDSVLLPVGSGVELSRRVA